MSDTVYIALLEANRLIIIVAALHARRPSLMARPEWRAVKSHSHIHDNSAHSELAYLLDTLAQLTTLYLERDKFVAVNSMQLAIETIPFPDTPAIRSLLDRSLNLLSDIQYRRSLWLESHPSSEFSTLPRSDTCSSSCYPFPEVLHFSSIGAANLSIIHSTAVILTHQFAASVHQLLPANAYNTQLEGTLAPTCIASAVTQILRSIDYYLTLTYSTSSSCSTSMWFSRIWLLPLPTPPCCL